MIGSLILSSAGTAGLLTAEGKSATDSDAISSSDKSKLWKSVTQGPLGVVGVLRKMAGKAAGITGVNLSISSLLRQSQVFTGLFGSLMQIIGAFVDITLAPLMPLIFRFFKWLASYGPQFAKFVEVLFRWAGNTVKWLVDNFVNPLLEAFGEDPLSWPEWKKKAIIPVVPGAMMQSKQGYKKDRSATSDYPGGDAGYYGSAAGLTMSGILTDVLEAKVKVDEMVEDTLFAGGQTAYNLNFNERTGYEGDRTAFQSAAEEMTSNEKLYAEWLEQAKLGYGPLFTGDSGSLLPGDTLSDLVDDIIPDLPVGLPDAEIITEQERFDRDYRNGSTYLLAIHNTEERSLQSSGLPY